MIAISDNEDVAKNLHYLCFITQMSDKPKLYLDYQLLKHVSYPNLDECEVGLYEIFYWKLIGNCLFLLMLMG